MYYAQYSLNFSSSRWDWKQNGTNPSGTRYIVDSALLSL